MTAPLISILIDTYNHDAFIEDAIRSVLDQDFPRSQMEILAVDDGSTDRTPEIIREFEPHVKLLRKPNGGQASAFNFGAAHAKGEFVAFLDGDDVWLPHKLSRAVAEFERCPNAVLVYHQFSYWDPRTGEEWDGGCRNLSGDILTDRKKLISYWAASTSSLTFRRKALERILPVPNGLTFMADAHLVRTAIFLGPVASLPECLTKNRVHGRNLWFTKSSKPSEDVLRNRIEVRKLAIQGVQEWVRMNVPVTARRNARVLFRVWRLVQEADEFALRPPHRLRMFAHLCRACVYSPHNTRSEALYQWAKAFAVLAVGRHAHYLEGVRTRLSKVTRNLQKLSARKTGEIPG